MIYTVTLNPAIDYVIQVPAFQEGKLNVTDGENKFPGGKGINVSRVLKQLEIPSINIGFIGGFTGQFVKDKLKMEDLTTNFIEVAGDTRINIKLKSQSETEINGKGPIIQLEDLQKLKEQLYVLTDRDLVILSGSIPQGVPKDIYVELVKEMTARNIPFVVDISSQDLLDILPYKPVLVKPNHHELGQLFEMTFTTFEEMIPYGEDLLEKGAQNVLISMGKDGAALFTKSGVYRVKGLVGELKNSVGAGDSMVAGFVSQWVQEKNIKTCLTYGVASGSATAFSDDLATKESILDLINHVQIEEIKTY